LKEGKFMTIGTQLSQANSQGTGLGQSATDPISFYGATPVAQRAASIQAASVVSVSSNITVAASLTSWVLEVTNTLVGLGLWKGGA
jgi:hypothetical protein